MIAQSGVEFTHDGTCYRTTSTVADSVPSGHLLIDDPGTITVGKCCMWYVRARRCCDSVIVGYVAETITPGYYVRSTDNCCYEVLDEASVHVCPASRMSGTLTAEPDYCCQTIIVDVVGVDGSVCPCDGGWKWDVLAVDGTYTLNAGCETSAGSSEFPAPGDSNHLQRYDGVGCVTPHLDGEYVAQLSLTITFADCTRRVVTGAVIAGFISGSGNPGSAAAFGWSGTANVADGTWLSNQIAACDIGSPGQSFAQQIATGGQIRVRFA